MYSTAPVGPAVRLVAQPGVIRAVSGAVVPVRIAAVDAANHVAATGAISATVEPQLSRRVSRDSFYARRPGSGRILMRNGALKGAIALEVQSAPSGIADRAAEAQRRQRWNPVAFGACLRCARLLAGASSGAGVACDGGIDRRAGSYRAAIGTTLGSRYASATFRQARASPSARTKSRCRLPTARALRRCRAEAAAASPAIRNAAVACNSRTRSEATNARRTQWPT